MFGEGVYSKIWCHVIAWMESVWMARASIVRPISVSWWIKMAIAAERMRGSRWSESFLQEELPTPGFCPGTKFEFAIPEDMSAFDSFVSFACEVSEVMAEAFKMVPWHCFWGCEYKRHEMIRMWKQWKFQTASWLVALKILWREGHSILRATNDHCSYLVMPWTSRVVHFNGCPSKVPGTICCTLRSWCCHNAWHNAAWNRPWVYHLPLWVSSRHPFLNFHHRPNLFSSINSTVEILMFCQHTEVLPIPKSKICRTSVAHHLWECCRWRWRN